MTAGGRDAMSAPQQDYAALAQRLRASAELYKFVPDLTGAADALAFLLGEVERLKALLVRCRPALDDTWAETVDPDLDDDIRAALGRGGE